ncbi:Na+/H+ antiporter subunit E [Bradyrhizobium canariense]|nr:Na+/H+ antiporter subunit E [Bradyrhizobium canariense]
MKAHCWIVHMEVRKIHELITGRRRAKPLGRGSGNTLRSAIFRAAGFFGFWLVLTDTDSADLAAGLVSAAAATWASLRLMPAEQWNLRPVKLAGFILHFLRQSIAAGTDVALRALDPRLPLRPGFVVYQTHLPPGTKRNAFCAIMSLLPGTLPCGSAEGDGLAIHCLDVTQPVVEQLAAEETLCMQTIGEAQRNG